MALQQVYAESITLSTPGDIPSNQGVRIPPPLQQFTIRFFDTADPATTVDCFCTYAKIGRLTVLDMAPFTSPALAGNTSILQASASLPSNLAPYSDTDFAGLSGQQGGVPNIVPISISFNSAGGLFYLNGLNATAVGNGLNVGANTFGFSGASLCYLSQD
jgi:hypothetical protein